jgi:hypothetical protein
MRAPKTNATANGNPVIEWKTPAVAAIVIRTKTVAMSKIARRFARKSLHDV